MPSAAVLAKKAEYDARVCGLLESYDRAFLCAADNVTSKQFMNIRAGLREKGSQILMGKNTLMKRCIRKYIERTGDQKWAELPEMMVGNVGIVFVKGELMEVRDIIDEFKVGAPAKMGVLAQLDVTIPAGPSGLDPSQTSFFQALNIPTKIVKGSIEITADVKVCTEGEKVSASAATLLGKLNIKPFAYNLGLVTVFDNGSVYDTKVAKYRKRINHGAYLMIVDVDDDSEREVVTAIHRHHPEVAIDKVTTEERQHEGVGN